ncbi:DUF2723 domain-containing protein [candidate division KSB1 bacterium]|nr:DUF2723 domain-containing protein [candidate division KSB1 bacterium]
MNKTFIYKKLFPALTLLCVAVIYRLTLAPDVLMGDGGRFQILAGVGGIAHPPGYALYTLTVYAFTRVCFADPAFCANLFSAVAALASLAVLYVLLRRLNIHYIIRIIALLTLAFSALFWLLSIRAEVYTFYLFFVAAALYLSLIAFDRFSVAAASAALFFWGVAVSGRPLFLPVVVVFILILWHQRRYFQKRYLFLLGGILFLLPMVLKIFYLGFVDFYSFGYNYIEQYNAEFAILPEADNLNHLLQRMSWLVSGSQFQSRIYVDVANMKTAVTELARLFFKANLTIVALPPAAAGGWRLYKRKPRFFILLALTIGCNLLYFFMTHAGDRITFLLPTLLVLTIAFAAGMEGVREWKYKAVAAFALLPLFLLLHNYANTDRSNLTLYRDFVVDFGRQAPTHASLFCPWPVSTALIYAQLIENCHSDVRIIPIHKSEIETYMNRYDFQAPFYKLEVDDKLNSSFLRLKSAGGNNR